MATDKNFKFLLAIIIQLFAPLIQYNCSAHLRLFICSVYVPFCSEQIPGAIPACRSLCENVRNDCKPHLDRIGRDWPPELACERFPNPPNLCFENPKEDKISEKFKISENFKQNLTFELSQQQNDSLKNVIKILYLVKLKNSKNNNGARVQSDFGNPNKDSLDLKNLDNLSKLKNLVTLLNFLKLKNLTSKNLGFDAKNEKSIGKSNFENLQFQKENFDPKILNFDDESSKITNFEKQNIDLKNRNLVSKRNNLENENFENLNLEKWDLQGLNLKNLDQILDLKNSDIKDQNLKNFDLKESKNLNLSGKEKESLKKVFKNPNFDNINLDNQDLKNTNLENLNLNNLNLENPTFDSSNVQDLNLENLNLENLNLENLNLDNLENLNQALKTLNFDSLNPFNLSQIQPHFNIKNLNPFKTLPETLQCPTRFIPIDDQCSPICGQDAFYKKRDKNFTKKWTITWAIGCAIATTFTLITHVLDTKNKNKKQSQIKLIQTTKNKNQNAKLATKIQYDAKLAPNENFSFIQTQPQLNMKIKKIKRQKFQYPERPILYMSICCLLYSLVTLSRLTIGGEFFICTNDGKLVTKSSQNMFCALSAILTQFLTLSVRLWWVIFCICWNLHTTYEWSPESLSKLSNWFHGIVNTLSLIPPVISLLTSQISADELTGSCTIKEEVSLYYIFLPQFLLLIFGGLISIRTTFSLCYIRNSLHIFGRTTISKLEKLMLRFCIFTVTYVLIEFCYLVCVAYESWHRPWWKSLALLSALDNPEPIYHTASIEVVLLKILFSFFIGICTVMWVCSGKTIRTWENIFCKKVFKNRLVKPINV